MPLMVLLLPTLNCLEALLFSGFMLPTAGFVDGRAPPHSRRAVEIEENAAARSRRVLEHEMAVEQNGFHLGQHRVVAVDVRPARLHHAHFGIGEVMDALQQKIGGRNKISVKDGDEFSRRCSQSFRQSARFVALTIVAVQVLDRMSQGGVALHQKAGDFNGFVGRVVEQLDVEVLARIVEPADGVEQPIYHVLLVEDRQLHSDPWQVIEIEMRRGFGRLVLFVLVIKIDQPVPVPAVGRQDDEDDEIGNQQRQVERVDLIEPLECLVQEMMPQDVLPL